MNIIEKFTKTHDISNISIPKLHRSFQKFLYVNDLPRAYNRIELEKARLDVMSKAKMEASRIRCKQDEILRYTNNNWN